MHFKSPVIVALTLMALVPATGAFALPTCGAATDLGAGLVEQVVIAEDGFTLVSFVVSGIVGGVVFDAGTCTGLGLTTCTFSGQGTPGGGVQSLSVDFADGGVQGVTTCTITDRDGLPVELIEFSVS